MKSVKICPMDISRYTVIPTFIYQNHDHKYEVILDRYKCVSYMWSVIQCMFINSFYVCIQMNAFIKITREDIQKVVGCLQLCVGQEAACEAGIFVMRGMFEEDNVEGVLFKLVDASNAFNSLNREAALRNIQILCPAIAPILINTYRNPAALIIGSTHILSQEGTTQGDPLAMAMYALGTLPLIQNLQENVTKTWYADDAAAGGELKGLRKWWAKLNTLGPMYGYHPSSQKQC